MTRRALHIGAVVGTAAHHGFELAAGVGLVFQPYLGLGGSLTAWGTALPAWRPSCWRLTGAVRLVEAEGLSRRQLPAYNSVLYMWGAAAVAALVAGTPRASRRWAAIGLLSAVPLALSARHHFEWLERVATQHPAWWNRAAPAVPCATLRAQHSPG